MDARRRELVLDIALGLLLAAVIAAVVILGAAADPTFIYQAF